MNTYDYSDEEDFRMVVDTTPTDSNDAGYLSDGEIYQTQEEKDAYKMSLLQPKPAPAPPKKISQSKPRYWKKSNWKKYQQVY